MLRFHESRRVVVTASRQQVREKLYGTSVNRWERYREFLAPLEAELAKAPDAA
jgi:flagellar biosynthesis chaperone FliJ